MIILAHRGYWLKKSEQNTLKALLQAVRLGFGIETDLRDYKGKIVIAHDFGTQKSILWDDFIKAYAQIKNPTMLALNIKADGLQDLLSKSLLRYNIKNYFLFDMSVADARRSWLKGLRVFTRVSEYEKVPAFYQQADGVWIDAFKSMWYKPVDIKKHYSKKKAIALVSAELHGREHMPVWKTWRDAGIHCLDQVMLCTDFPQEAKDFFNESR